MPLKVIRMNMPGNLQVIGNTHYTHIHALLKVIYTLFY